MKLVSGLGINDSDYRVCIRETIGYTSSGKQIQKVIWSCPYYRVWADMLRRCNPLRNKSTGYSGKILKCCEEWLKFSKFKLWAEREYFEDLSLDKDILVKGNNIYGPETCCLVPHYINTLILTSKRRSNNLIGTCYKLNRKHLDKPYMATSNNKNYLGYFSTEYEAHEAWRNEKINQIYSQLDLYSRSKYFDSRVADALLCRIWDMKIDQNFNRPTENL